ncbi:MAG: amidohydrolase family protein [Advenella sp.]|nr:amidohydrolase family protein [Advenella sp. S44]
MPENACDCHTHIFERHDLYPLSPQRTYTPAFAPLSGLLSHLNDCQLGRVVLVQPSPYGSDNSCLLDALNQIPQIGRGVAVIDRYTTDSQLRAMHEGGIRGARVNLQTHGISDPLYAENELQWIADRIAAFGWHIQIFTNLQVLDHLYKTILSLPTDVVVDHFSQASASLGNEQVGFPRLLDLMALGKVWVKMSAAQRISTLTDCADVEPIARSLIEANPERVIWGSDWPHPGAQAGQPRSKARIEPFNDVDDIQALNRIAIWTDFDDHLQKILVDNPRKLYGFNS